MKCIQCQHENRTGARFCEVCGARLKENNCLACGHTNQPGARFCENCGAALEQQADKPTALLCPICGRRNRLGVRFCEECGTNILTEAPRETQEIRMPRRVKQPAKSNITRSLFRFGINFLASYLISAALIFFANIIGNLLTDNIIPDHEGQALLVAQKYMLENYSQLVSARTEITLADYEGTLIYIVDFIHQDPDVPIALRVVVDAENGNIYAHEFYDGRQ